jgi:hypothetical protein
MRSLDCHRPNSLDLVLRKALLHGLAEWIAVPLNWSDCGGSGFSDSG